MLATGSLRSEPILRQAVPYLFVIILALALLLPLAPLVSSPLHPDEALYARWGLLISGGQDRMLNSVPVDKPPIFPYLLGLLFQAFSFSEPIVRFPGMVAHVITVSLTFLIGRAIYQPGGGLLAAFLTALSPFSILFAPTALTDPLMLALVMAALWAALRGYALGAGVWLSLAVATKQQGLFFAPLILGVLLLAPVNPNLSHNAPTSRFRSVLIWSVTLAIGLLIPLVWDAYRTYRPGFWLQSTLSYGKLTLTLPHLPNRFISFSHLLTYTTGNLALNFIFIIGLPLLLLAHRGLRLNSSSVRFDRLLTGFCLGYLILHSLLTFQIWDRYLLGLVPLLALLMARILHLPALLWANLIDEQTSLVADLNSLGAIALVAGLMLTPVRRAINTDYPLGGDHGAYVGVAEIAAYLRKNAGSNVILYHRWLGTHWRTYLFDFPYELRYWPDAAYLARRAGESAGQVQYIAFPAWQSMTPAQLALADRGLRLMPIFRTIRQDGTPAIYLYQIKPIHHP